MSKFSFGSDPEFMLKKGNEYISAIAVVPGDIGARIQKNGHEFYWDNVMAECAIKPSYSKDEALVNFQEALKLYAEIVAPCKLVAQASQDYSEKALAGDGPDDKRARTAGCKPDTCAYLMKKMKGADSARDAIAGGSLRTCGGHIHLGQDGGVLDGSGPEPVLAVYSLDLFLGIPSLFMDNDPTSAKRREIYGHAGRYRAKPYGFEYRSLGNFWLASPKILELVYDICEFVVGFVEGEEWKDLWQFNEDLYWELLGDEIDPGESFSCKLFDKFKLKECIDNNDTKNAKMFLEFAEEYMPESLYARVKSQMARRSTYNLYKEWSL